MEVIDMATLTFFGHSTFQIEGGGKTLLFDPFLDENPSANVRAGEVSCDYILVSHAHQDHFADVLPIAKRTGATVIANFEIAARCQSEGIEAHPLHIGGGYDFPFGRVKLTIAHHGSSFPDGSYGGEAAGITVSLEGKKVHYAGDTALTHDMSFVGDEGIDLALVPIGDNFTMGIDDAIRSLDLLKPKAVVPVHYGTWPPIEQDPERFAAGAREKGVTCHVLRSGARLEI